MRTPKPPSTTTIQVFSSATTHHPCCLPACLICYFITSGIRQVNVNLGTRLWCHVTKSPLFQQIDIEGSLRRYFTLPSHPPPPNQKVPQLIRRWRLNEYKTRRHNNNRNALMEKGVWGREVVIVAVNVYLFLLVAVCKHVLLVINSNGKSE